MSFHSPIEPSAQPPEESASAGAPPANLPALIEALPGDDTRAAQTGFDLARQKVFLHALADCGMTRRAARSVGVSHQSAYRMRRANPAFRRAWDAALLAARAVAEDVLACRALEGVEEKVFYRGEEIAVRRRYDSRLLLAHLGRLDKLAEDAATSAFADDFETALERFERGEDQPGAERDPAEAGTPAGRAPGEGHGAPSGAGISPPGQCNMRSMSLADAEPEPCPECGGACLDPDPARADSDCPVFEGRVADMFEARPSDERWPNEFEGYDEQAVMLAQIEAYEAGVAGWWGVLPRRPGDPAGAWRYAEDEEGED